MHLIKHIKKAETEENPRHRMINIIMIYHKTTDIHQII